MAANETTILFLSLTSETPLSCSCHFPRASSGGCEAIHESVLLLGKIKNKKKLPKQVDKMTHPVTPQLLDLTQGVVG